MKFSEASAVTRVSPGVYTADIQPDWDIFGVTNGGYLLATAVRAMGEEAPGRTLAGVSARFINPNRADPITIEVDTLKVGRSLSTLTAAVTTEGKPLITASASFSDGSNENRGSALVVSEPPDLPPVEDCVRLLPTSDAPLPPPFSGQVGCYLHPEDVAQFGQAQERPPVMRGWFRLLDDELLDPVGLVLASDGFPPAIFNSGLPVGWTPTVDLTVHIRNPGPHEWLRCQFVTRFVTGGWLEEDGEFWDLDGNLVAQSRQLALLAN